jgi:hypothetical protein
MLPRFLCRPTSNSAKIPGSVADKGCRCLRQSSAVKFNVAAVSTAVGRAGKTSCGRRWCWTSLRCQPTNALGPKGGDRSVTPPPSPSKQQSHLCVSSLSRLALSISLCLWEDSVAGQWRGKQSMDLSPTRARPRVASSPRLGCRRRLWRVSASAIADNRWLLGRRPHRQRRAGKRSSKGRGVAPASCRDSHAGWNDPNGD